MDGDIRFHSFAGFLWTLWGSHAGKRLAVPVCGDSGWTAGCGYRAVRCRPPPHVCSDNTFVFIHASGAGQLGFLLSVSDISCASCKKNPKRRGPVGIRASRLPGLSEKGPVPDDSLPLVGVLPFFRDAFKTDQSCTVYMGSSIWNCPLHFGFTIISPICKRQIYSRKFYISPKSTIYHPQCMISSH